MSDLFDLEAEQSVLGSILEDDQYLPAVADILGENEKVFYTVEHQVIYRAMLDLAREGEKIDPVTVASQLKNTGRENLLKSGLVYLHDLRMSVPTATNAPVYARRVREMWVRRDIISVAREMAEQARDMDCSVEEILARFGQRLLQSLDQGDLSVSDLADRLMEEFVRRSMGGEVGLATGFPSIDELLCGLRPGNYMILGGRPSNGKSALALTITYHVLQSGKPVLFFSLEMSKEEVMERLYSIASCVPLNQIRTGVLNKDDFARLEEARRRIKDLPLYLEDARYSDFFKLANKVRGVRMERPDLALVVIDYFQLLSKSGNRESRYVELTEISRELKLLASDVKVPFLVLSQLSREIEKRADPIPKLSDLRETGGQEQDADIIAFLALNRATYPDSPDKDPNQAVFYVRKNRNGRTGSIYLRFIPSEVKFKEERT